MVFPLFSERWATRLRKVIDESPAYREHGRSWTGSIVLTDGDRGVMLDLEGGRCHEARPLEKGDHEEARVVLGADGNTWDRILAGELDPITAVMARELRLEKGTVLELLPHLEGARIIFRSVRELAHDPR